MLCTQEDKIGKEQGAVKDGDALHRAVHDEVQNRKNEERMEGVMEAEQTGEGLSGIHDPKGRQGGGQSRGGTKNPEQKNSRPVPPKMAAYHDPALGTNLDLSG
jgi:hypothetical protein